MVRACYCFDFGNLDRATNLGQARKFERARFTKNLLHQPILEVSSEMSSEFQATLSGWSIKVA